MPRILVVDDEETIRLLFRNLFEAEGYEVIEAEDGEQGLELYQKHPADLVITDIVMPKKNGLEVIKELKKQDRKAKVIGVASIPDVLSEAEKAGADATLPKPFKVDEVLHLVKELLEG